MLARPVFTLVKGAAGSSPNVLAHAAIDLVFRFRALRHRNSSLFSFSEERALLCAPESADRLLAEQGWKAAGASNDKRALVARERA
jgi:hypothetical protein